MIGVIKGTMRQKKEVNGLPLPIASYKANMKAPIRSLKVAITAQQSGSGTPAPDNIRPISGWSECNVTRCGKNVWSYGNVSGTQRKAITVDIKAGTYTISANVTSSDTDYDYNLILFYYEDNTTESVYIDRGTRQSVTVTLSKNVKSINFYASRGNNQSVGDTFSFTDIQLEVGSTATAYEAYTGNTYIIQLGDTYYGCMLDATNGVLTVTYGITDLVNLNWSYDSDAKRWRGIKSDMKQYSSRSDDITFEKYATDTTATSGSEWKGYISGSYIYIHSLDSVTPPSGNAVYPLATPVTIQLTPTQIEQLLGANNVFADTGDVEELEYTDRQVYYGR